MPVAITPRRKITALFAGLVVAVTGLAACQPGPTPPRPNPVPRAATADVDTFTVSNQPTATRGNDVVLRIMDSAGKLKVGYLSFPVASVDTTSLAATLTFVPRHSGFALDVHNAGSFTDDTTHVTRPTLGTEVGAVSTTRANVLQSVALRGVTVRRGRAYLAITTASAYELEITSTEGANGTTPAPTLEVDPSTPPPTTSPPPTTTPSGPDSWNLAWSDEFDGSRVDPAKWSVYDEGTAWGAFTSTKATACPKASNASVSGGILIMRTRKANGACAGGQAQSGAALTSWGKFEQAQGRFEARVRWTTTGNNLWGGFWTHANGGYGYDKSMGSELDIFEYIGKTAEPNISRYKPAIHFNYTCNPKCMQNVPINGHDVTRWHTYAVEWEPTVAGDPTSTQIRFYEDDVLVAQFDRFGAWAVNSYGTKVLVDQGGWTSPNAPFPAPFGPDRAHKIMLSATVGAPLTDPATVARGFAPPGGVADLQVDYVRVYRR